MASECGSMTSEGGTLISEGGTFFGVSMHPREHYDQDVIIWVLEMICRRANPFKTAPSAVPPFWRWKTLFFNRLGASAPEAPCIRPWRGGGEEGREERTETTPSSVWPR